MLRKIQGLLSRIVDKIAEELVVLLLFNFMRFYQKEKTNPLVSF